MPDYSQFTKGLLGGLEASQRFRANRQLEKQRDYDLETQEYKSQERRANRRIRDPDTEKELGALDPNSVQDYQGLEDPFAMKLLNFFSGKPKKPRQGIAAPPAPMAPQQQSPLQQQQAQMPMQQAPAPETQFETYPYPEFADGGAITEEEMIRRRAMENRARTRASVQNATETVSGADRTASGGPRSALGRADEAVGKFVNSRGVPGEGMMNKLRNAGRGLKGAGALGALAGTAADVANTSTEDYRERFGLETNDPSLPGDVGVRTIGAMADLGNTMTLGLAGRFFRDKQRKAAEAQAEPAMMAPQEEQAPREAISVGSAAKPRTRSAIQQKAPEPQMMNFAESDIEPADVPDMQTNDWKKYRAKVLDAARLSGDQEAVSRANDRVTDMQQKGFINYSQQGLALLEAGNQKGAMSAFRAAYQYFPNGYDVEFGTKNGKVIGYGRDEKTGKVQPGTEMIMDPERVATLIENFKNPAAFRMWTKDWRDFQQEERKYQEVTKPLAQAQADSLATNSEASMLRAEAAEARAAAAGSKNNALRGFEKVARERVSMLGLEDEEQADYLASIMSRVKQANPNVPDNTIIQAIMKAQTDGTLAERLQKMGID